MSLSSWTTLYFGFSFNEAYHTSEFEFIQMKIVFSFSHGSLHGNILEFRFLSYPKLCSWFSTKKRQLLMCFHPFTTSWQLFMCLLPVMNEQQPTHFRSLKSYQLLTFGGFSLNTNRGRKSASPLTHAWLIGSEALPCPYLIL